MIYQTDYGMVDVVTRVIDYINSDGDIVNDSPTKEIQITDESDLAGLTDYPVGSIAYTANLQLVYILDANSEWVQLGGE